MKSAICSACFVGSTEGTGLRSTTGRWWSSDLHWRLVSRTMLTREAKPLADHRHLEAVGKNEDLEAVRHQLVRAPEPSPRSPP